LDEFVEISEVVAACSMGIVEIIGEVAKSVEYGHVCRHVNRISSMVEYGPLTKFVVLLWGEGGCPQFSKH
jgi:hypothetical protein